MKSNLNYIEKRAKELRDLLNKANHSYYILDSPILNDEIYDDIIFMLWKRHVIKTGQTYYPPMQKELLIEVELLEEEEIAD